MLNGPGPVPRALRRLTLPVLVAGVAAGALVTTATSPAQAATSAVAKPENLLAAPYKVEQRLAADLDKDGDLDVAIVGVDGRVPMPETMEESDGDGERILLIARKDPDGYRAVGSSTTALMCRRCGGAFWGVIPAPIEMTAAKGVLVVTQSAGSREVTDWTHRFRIESGRVRLIGLDRTNNDRLGPTTVTTSTNLLTGVTITTTVTSSADGKTESSKSKTTKGKARTVWLENVELS